MGESDTTEKLFCDDFGLWVSSCHEGMMHYDVAGVLLYVALTLAVRALRDATAKNECELNMQV